MWLRSVVAAPGGGDPSHTASARAPDETGTLADRSKLASRARWRAPDTATGSPAPPASISVPSNAKRTPLIHASDLRPAHWPTGASWRAGPAGGPRTPPPDHRPRRPASASRVTRNAHRSSTPRYPCCRSAGSGHSTQIVRALHADATRIARRTLILTPTNPARVPRPGSCFTPKLRKVVSDQQGHNSKAGSQESRGELHASLGYLPL